MSRLSKLGRHDRGHENTTTYDRRHDGAHAADHVDDRDHHGDRHDRDHDGVDDRMERDRGSSGRLADRPDEAAARDKFGGANLGAAFFGWLVAIGVTILLSGIISAIATAVGANANVTQSDAQREAGTIGLVAAAVLAAVLLLAYYTGGYVAGRMSRFDGGRQGLAVWVLGLLVTALAVGLGLLFGSEFNILDQVSLPRIPLPTRDLTLGGAIAALVILVGTLLAAMTGGKVGRRYHDRVDRAYYR